jgi:Permuted papain-like amidase enzyme, YaeF/YiiX, C92 family
MVIKMKNLLRKTALQLSYVFAAFTLGGCDTTEPKTATTKTDSVFAALNKLNDTIKPVLQDTSKMLALPPVMEGDIIFIQSNDPRAIALQKASDSKYSHVGIVFQKPGENQYFVVNVLDSVQKIPLSQWIGQSADGKVALLRLKDSSRLLSEKKTAKLKTKVREMKGKPFDPYFGWGNDAFYSSEFVWKMYAFGLNFEICPTHSLTQFHLDDPLVKAVTGGNLKPATGENDKAISPDDLYKSPKLEIIYEH